MFRKWLLPAVGLLTLIVAAPPAETRAQFLRSPNEPDLTIDAATRARVVEGLVKQLDAGYVFPETAKKMGADLRAKLAEHAYDNVTSAKAFATVLTKDLQAISHDKHLRVTHSFETLPPETIDKEPPPAEMEKMRRFLRTRNFGFEKVERLEGNIGYLDLRNFMPADMAGDTAAAAMAFLANTDALIIDLRKNGGGSPDMVALFCSYLFPAAPVVHLNDLYFRPENTTHQWWTQAYVPGKRYVDKNVYVLTSHRTFSAAEECTYNLKSLKRATIVGETTGGGAHPGGPRRLDDHFEVFVPMGRAINPITKTNWEGTGVQPDIAVPADLALKTAYLAALDKVATLHKEGPDAEQFKHLQEKARKELDDLKSKKPAASPDGPSDGEHGRGTDK
jgi:retinol-binding protein 3